MIAPTPTTPHTYDLNEPWICTFFAANMQGPQFRP
jgi:hypothetical protein